jgi:hypothetical protein
MDEVNPLERAWSLYNEIVLTIINESVHLVVKEIFDFTNFWLHKILKESLVDLMGVHVEGDLGVELENALNGWIVEELFH